MRWRNNPSSQIPDESPTSRVPSTFRSLSLPSFGRALCLFLCLSGAAPRTTTTTAAATAKVVDLAEPRRLLDTACPVKSFVDVQAEYIRYPVCLETRWVLGAAASVSPDNTSGGSSRDGRGSAAAAAEEAEEPVASALSVGVEESANATATDKSSSLETATETETEAETEAEAEAEADSDSPLDKANFLSFEEWKKLNLAKAGQSAENIGARSNKQGAEGGTAEDRKRRAQAEGINNALDGLGEDTEIELEFGGFATKAEDIRSWERKGVSSSDSASSASQNAGEGEQQHIAPGAEGEDQSDEGVQPRGAARRKEAGTTCKERFNYASFDCAATVLKTNPQCSGSSSILIENKDSYMLNECQAENKFLILELCDDIQVDTVVLANYEFFSSIFRTFRVSVTDRYPAKPDMWKELGTYEAANTREVQAFAVDNPLIWARYLRIEFLTHYGNEFYCPVSLIRVHGTTMMEDYKNDGDAARIEAEEDEVVAGDIVSGEVSPTHAQENADIGSESEGGAGDAQRKSLTGQEATGNLTEICQPQRAYVENLLLGFVPMDICPVEGSAYATDTKSSAATDPSPTEKIAVDGATAMASSAVASSASAEEVTASDAAVHTSSGPESRPQQPSQETPVTTPSSSQRTESAAPTETTKSSTTTTQQQQQQAQQSQTQFPHTPSPSTQESFFKSVNKRLQMLETNSSLSLLYIEEQSRILRDAFNKVEKRQLAKTSNFLENLNSTVLHELREFRQQYDHVWHSVIIDFEQQRQQYHRELFDVSTQLGVLADELVFQKRITIIQSVFVLICFGLVLFSRGTVGTYLELPGVQSFVSRSQSVRSSSPSYETPSTTPSPKQEQHGVYQETMAQHHHNHLHGHQQHHPSDESRPESVSEPIVAFSAPTPSASDIASTRSDGDENVYHHRHDLSTSSAVPNSMLLDPGSGLVRRQRSSPPSLGRADSADSMDVVGDHDAAISLAPS